MDKRKTPKPIKRRQVPWWKRALLAIGFILLLPFVVAGKIRDWVYRSWR